MILKLSPFFVPSSTSSSGNLFISPQDISNAPSNLFSSFGSAASSAISGIESGLSSVGNIIENFEVENKFKSSDKKASVITNRETTRGQSNLFKIDHF